jgi:hypothetical protein
MPHLIQFAGLLILMSFQDFYQLKYYTFLAVKNDNSDYLPMRIDILFSKMPCEGTPAPTQPSPSSSKMSYNTSRATWKRN